ncbi:MAG TPA: serine hydrolase domain-containing protein [Kofleriaceae bacterium]|nr:serine hydrolase domain-containing protein [Kofleriaceae bacterium]
MTARGLPAAALGRIRAAVAGLVETGEVPGAVWLIARGGDTHVDAIGVRNTDTGAAMRRDTIFRLSSMTKPITAVAAMILVEAGAIALDEPVDRLLPELAGRRVLARLGAPLDQTVPAARSITVRDLLTLRMGFGLLAEPRGYPIQDAIRDLHVGGRLSPEAPPPDEWIRRFATLPLMFQPGERWMYNTGSDVLGVLIARAAGQPLAAVLRERVLEPLGMIDTGFHAPPVSHDRLSTSYEADPETGVLRLYDVAAGGRWSRAPRFASAAAGLVSTIDDYFAFGRMMLDRGAAGAARILSPASIAAMTTDAIAPAQKAISDLSMLPGFWTELGWGLGLSVLDGPSVPRGFGWVGGLGTSWYTDPAADLVAILMTNRGEYPLTARVYRAFWDAVYRAVDG